MRCESGDRQPSGLTVGWQTAFYQHPKISRRPLPDGRETIGSAPLKMRRRSQPFSARGEDRPRLSSDQMTPTGFEHHRKLAKDPLQILNTWRRRMPKGLLMERLKGSHEARSARGLLPMREGLRPC